MASYLIRCSPTRPEDKNASGLNAVLVTGADEAAARAAAIAAAPNGETRVPATWVATQLASSALPAGVGPVSWVQGNLVLPGELRRGQ
jgi:hypothetical protein